MSLQSTVWRSVLCLPHWAEADWDEPRIGTYHLHPPPPTTTHPHPHTLFTLVNVCACERVCVCVCESMCLIKPRLAIPSVLWMPLNLLQSLHHRRLFIYIPRALFEEYLRWGNIFSECPSYRFTPTPMGLKSCFCSPGEEFSPNETQDQ